MNRISDLIKILLIVTRAVLTFVVYCISRATLQAMNTFNQDVFYKRDLSKEKQTTEQSNCKDLI